MKFGICNEMFEGWKLPDIFKKAKELGYDGVEIAPFTLAKDPGTVSAADRQEIKRQASDAGVEVVGLHWLLAKTEGLHLTCADEDIRSRTKNYLVELVALCSDLGGKVMIFGSPQQRSLTEGVSREQARHYAKETLKAVARECESRDVTFCIEPLGPEETDFINTADEAWELAQEIGSPNMQIILDVKAMSTETEEIPEIIQRHALHAGHVHANDPNRRGPGFGDVDFVPILRKLNQMNYAKYVSVEVFNFQPDPVTIGRESINYLQKCLREATDNE